MEGTVVSATSFLNMKCDNYWYMISKKKINVASWKYDRYKISKTVVLTATIFEHAKYIIIVNLHIMILIL